MINEEFERLAGLTDEQQVDSKLIEGVDKKKSWQMIKELVLDHRHETADQLPDTKVLEYLARSDDELANEFMEELGEQIQNIREEFAEELSVDIRRVDEGAVYNTLGVEDIDEYDGSPEDAVDELVSELGEDEAYSAIKQAANVSDEDFLEDMADIVDEESEDGEEEQGESTDFESIQSKLDEVRSLLLEGTQVKFGGFYDNSMLYMVLNTGGEWVPYAWDLTSIGDIQEQKRFARKVKERSQYKQGWNAVNQMLEDRLGPGERNRAPVGSARSLVPPDEDAEL